MVDVLQKVKPGDSLNIPAAAYNAFVDAARAHRDGQLGKGGTVTRSTRDSGVVYVKNCTSADLARFDAVGFHGGIVSGTYPPPFTPDNNLESFQNTPTLNVYDLFRSYNDGDGDLDSRGRFVILLDPIPFGEIGRACISGLCVAQIYVQDERHRYADVVAVGESLLWSDRTGAAQILWKESGTGTKWAVLRLGVPAADPIQFGKVVSYTFGAASFTVNPCDWRGYDVNTSETITVKISQSANWAYYPLTKVLAAGDVVAFQHLYTEIYSPFGKYAVLVDPRVEELIKGQAAADAILETDIFGDGHPAAGTQGGTVDVHPYVGGVVDESITINISLPVIGSGAPNVREGNQVIFRAKDLVCVSQYMDEAVGVIKLWAEGAIPAGWALCDGQNGTVDLADRFIVGAGGAYSVGDTGGYEKHGATENNHDAHVISSHNQSYTPAQSGSGVNVLTGVGNHSNLNHSDADNRPPYYALCYIQRVN